MRESAFKSTIFVGVPRVSSDQARGGVYDLIASFWGSRVFLWFFGSFAQVILSLAELTNALEDDVKERLPKTLTRFVFHRMLHSVSCGNARMMTHMKSPGRKTWKRLSHEVGSCGIRFMSPTRSNSTIN